MRSRLVVAGFVPTMSIVSELEVEDPYCAICGAFVDARGWMHVASTRFICRVCMGDPHENDGEAGRRMADRLEAVNDQERRDRYVIY